MIWTPFQLLPQKFLGVDIGTSYIKIVEIARVGHRRKLENYGSLSAAVLYEKPFRTFEKSSLLLSSHDIARAIVAVLEEAKIKTRKVIFSIPDFSSFFTNIELPAMTEEELSQAVPFEARQHVPLPLAEVTLDWQIAQGRPGNKTGLKILLVAVPNEVINQYQEIARLCQLELVSLEAEAFGLIRSLVKEEENGSLAIIDIGAQSTTCNIVDRKILQISNSFDMAGNEFSRVIANGLNIDYKQAEVFKKKFGIISGPNKEGEDVRQILTPLIDIILRETERIFNNFSSKGGREIQKIILAGGSTFLPGLKKYFSQNLKKEIEIANPFYNIFYPPILEKTLKEMGPAFAIAIGTALRGLER